MVILIPIIMIIKWHRLDIIMMHQLVLIVPVQYFFSHSIISVDIVTCDWLTNLHSQTKYEKQESAI